MCNNIIPRSNCIGKKLHIYLNNDLHFIYLCICRMRLYYINEEQIGIPIPIPDRVLNDMMNLPCTGK